MRPPAKKQQNLIVDKITTKKSLSLSHIAVTHVAIMRAVGGQTIQRGRSWLSMLFFILSIGALALSWYWYSSHQKPEVEAVTREGVIQKIQALNRLQTVGFSVDTVITSQKQGNWYNLWQDQQKGLFVAHGRVVAGIDLNKLTPEQVKISQISIDQKDIDDVTPNVTMNVIRNNNTDVTSQPAIVITIPPAEIFDVYLDDVEVYDLQTGLFGILKTDPAIFEKAQEAGKVQVLQTACKGDVLQMATDNAQKQVEGLFRLTGFDVTVITQEPKGC